MLFKSFFFLIVPICRAKKNSFFPPEYDDINPRKPDSVKAAVLDEYSGVTTAHGVPRIITSKSILSKLFWACVTLAALGLFLWQGSLLLFDFQGHPYTTQIDVVTQTEVQFPAVTVCNMNKMRRSAMVGTRFESLIEADGGVNGGDADYSWWFWLVFGMGGWSMNHHQERKAVKRIFGPSAVGSISVGTSQSVVDMSGDSATDSSSFNTMANFTDIPDGNSSTYPSSTPPNQEYSTQSDVDTASATSDGTESFVDEEWSSTDEVPPLREAEVRPPSHPWSYHW